MERSPSTIRRPPRKTGGLRAARRREGTGARSHGPTRGFAGPPSLGNRHGRYGLSDSERLARRISEFLLALADASRLRVLLALGDDERSVTDLTEETRVPRVEVSRAIAHLHRAGLLASRRNRQRVVYRAKGPEVFAVCRSVRDSLERSLAEESDDPMTSGVRPSQA